MNYLMFKNKLSIFKYYINIYKKKNYFSLYISLVTGNDQVDYENIACQLRANFDENKLETLIVTDGKSEVTGDENSATDLITTGKRYFCRFI